MKRNNKQDDDHATKARERAFRTTTNLSAIAGEMQNTANREPDNSSNAFSPENLQTNTHMVPTSSTMPMGSSQKPLIEPGSSNVAKPSSQATDDAIKARERQFRTTKVLSNSLTRKLGPPSVERHTPSSQIWDVSSSNVVESDKPPNSESKARANPTSTTARNFEDERMKQREREFRSTKIANTSTLRASLPDIGAEPTEPSREVWNSASLGVTTTQTLPSMKVKTAREVGDENIKLQERQFRSIATSNALPSAEKYTMENTEPGLYQPGIISGPGSTSVSNHGEPTNQSDARVAEDERVKARLRQFRTTSRVPDVSSRLSTTIPENRGPQPFDPVTDSTSGWRPGVNVAAGAAPAGNASGPSVASPASTSAPGNSSSSTPYSGTASIPSTVSLHGSEEARLKARENQFRSATVPNLSNFVESTSTLDPAGQNDTQTVVSESPSVWSEASADRSRQTTTSDGRIKARMRQFRTTTPADNSRSIENASGAILGTLQSCESTITNKKSTNHRDARATGVGAYSVVVHGETATVNQREPSVGPTNTNNAADLGIKGKRGHRSPRQKLSKKRQSNNVHSRVSVEAGSVGNEETPEEDANSRNAESAPEKGAMRISNGGLAVHVHRGTLTPHPEDIALGTLAAYDTDSVEDPEEPEAPQDVAEESKKDVLPDAASPWYKSRIFVAVCVLIIVVAAVVGAVLAMSGGNGTPLVATNLPTPSPTEIPIDLERMAAARSHIVNRVSSGEQLDDKSSPQYFALLWITADDNVSPIAADSPSDEVQQLRVRYILACMYYSLNGDSWLSKRDWLNGNGDHCNWEYITCDINTGFVTEINSGGDANMQGSLPSEILHLSSLDKIILRGNRITSVPAFDDGISYLAELFLDENPIGNIPSIRKLTSLEILSLRDTGMAGSLGTSFSNLTNLRHLDLSDNELSGTLTSEFHHMTNLVELRLRNNMFDGDIDEILTDLDQLGIIDLGQNYFHGRFGSNFLNLTRLETVFLSGNSLSGPLPAEVFQITNLIKLDVTRNSGITGTIATEIGNLHDSLTELRLEQTSLSGSIPSELWQLTKLQKVYLPFLSGTLPQENCDLQVLKDIRYFCDLFQCDCPGVCFGDCDN